MKVRTLVLLGCSLMCVTISLSEESGMKPRTVRRQKASEIKPALATEFEKLLTTSFSLVAAASTLTESLAHRMNVIVKKMKTLLAGDDDFFAKRKGQQLECYRVRLERMRSDMEKLCSQMESVVSKMEQELQALEKNFDL